MSRLACTLPVLIIPLLCVPILGQEPQTLAGHEKPITAIAFSPDGKSLASTGLDNKIQLWDFSQQKAGFTLTGEFQGVYALAFAPDGKTLASGGGDRLIRLWDTATGKELRQLKAPDTVAALAVAPGGKLLASGGYDKVIRLWDPGTGAEVRQLQGHEGRVTALAFSADGARLASGGTISRKIEAGTNAIFTGEADQVRLWDPATGRELRRLESRGSSLVFAPDGKTLYCAGLVMTVQARGRGTSIDGGDQITFVDVEKGTPLRVIVDRGSVAAAAPDGSMIATGAGSWLHLMDFGVIANNNAATRRLDRRVALWDTSNGRETLRLPEDAATALAFSPDSRTLAAGTARGRIVLWNLEEEKRRAAQAGQLAEAPPKPPPGLRPLTPEEKKLADELDADFEELLKKERSSTKLRQAAVLLAETNQSDRWTHYMEAIAIIRQTRPKAAIPLLLKYMVIHSSLGNGNRMVASYADTLTILTGKEFADPYRYVEERTQPVREAVGKLVETWWRPNKDKVSTDLSAMSREQLQVIVHRLLKGHERELREDYGDLVDRLGRLLSTLLREERDRRRHSWPQDLCDAMLPFLLEDAGYEENPPLRPVAREAYRIPYAAIPLLAALRENGEAPQLDEIADDPRQNSAVRLTCVLALHAAHEDMRTPVLLSVLDEEKKLERRLVAILTLRHAHDGGQAGDKLLKLLDDPNEQVQVAAFNTLAAVAPRDAFPRMKKVLESGKPARVIHTALRSVAAVGTKEAQGAVAAFLQSTLDDPQRSVYLLYALSAFEQAAGQRWLEAGAHSQAYYREKAKVALDWWTKQK